MSQDNNEAASAPAAFANYMVKNYPAGTVIGDPLWHVPRIYRAAVQAASASQSSTPVPRVGGNTFDELLSIGGSMSNMLYNIAQGSFTLAEYADNARTLQKKWDAARSDLAHVARQRQESAAVAEGVDTALPPPALTVADEPGRGHYYSAEQMAQQREAERQHQLARIRHLEHERDKARAVITHHVGELLSLAAQWENVASKIENKATANVMRNDALHLRATLESLSAAPPATRPVPMILHCPACGVQHIDAPDERTEGWENPPHRSHLCHGCGHIWRPADVPTEGVAAIQTRGSIDSAAPPAKAEGMTPEQINAATEAIFKESGYTISAERVRAILAQQSKGARHD